MLIKGADNVMLERASREQSNATLVQHLLDFSNLGLRTLVLAQRHMSQMETERWHLEYKVGVVVCCWVCCLEYKVGVVVCCCVCCLVLLCAACYDCRAQAPAPSE